MFPRRFYQICLELDYLVFTSSDFAKIILLQSNIVSLASNSQTGEGGSCIYVRHEQGGPVSSPSPFTTRRVTVEVL
jgi:hypothetical protein